MPKNQPELKLISLEDVVVEPVRWLWYPYIPLGKLSILHGDPGEGKTTLALWIAAACSRGLALPGGENKEPLTVLYQTAEDGLGVSVNSSNAVDKREQPPRKDGCSLFHVNARLRRKKMERRLQEKQIPIGLLSKQVVLQVEEAAQFSGGSIRHKIEEPVSQVALVLKDVQVCKRDSRKLVRHSGTSPGCVGL